MELINIQGEETPSIIFKPYIWAVVKDYGCCTTFEHNREIKVIMKEGYKYGKGFYTVKY